MNKQMGYVHVVAIKWDEVLGHGTTWMNLEKIMLSEKSQLTEVRMLILFILKSRIWKFIETEVD